MVGGPICSEWLVLFSHWSVDLWLIDWLANRISSTFFHFWKTCSQFVTGILLQHMPLTPMFGIINLPLELFIRLSSYYNSAFDIFGYIYFIHGLNYMLWYGLPFPLEYLDKASDVLYGSSILNMIQVSAYFVFLWFVL